MPKAKIIGRCRLCKTEAILVDSHIISDFYYKSLKKTDGFFLVQSSNSEKKSYKKQKGITEHLLCATCDNERLSHYEDHLAKVVFGGHPLDGVVDRRLHTIKGYDYKKIKNGLLSILWRMSVSSHAFFSEVNLGEKHEEFLRLGLLNNFTFKEEQYPVLLTAPFFDGHVLGNWMVPPDFARMEGNRVYRCLISGLLFTFIVGSAPLADKLRPIILRTTSWPIIKAKVEEIPFLLDACVQVARANAVRDADE